MRSRRISRILTRTVATAALVLSACGDTVPRKEGADCLPRAETSPNVLLIVVDTLRADRLTFYGHERDTSPQMQSRLADRGVVFERAYAQAPWTLPSVASLLTGQDPARFLDKDGNPWGIPDAAETLAEAFSARGFQTYGFVANPTLHEGNGFAQGFDHFETAPYDVASLSLHADALDAKIAAHLPQLREPFFLYAHYLDPHDPYDNPDLKNGLSPFFPDYEGALTGSDVHGLYLGQQHMTDPESDVAHLRALYDSEIRYVDKFVGKLLDRLGPERLERTLMVLTSDHGEELYDHRGWKHGESVYQEQIHVPLVFRWDGVLTAGRRIPDTVRLLDVMPTLLDLSTAEGVASEDPATEVPALRERDGRSLRAALCEEEGLSPLPAFARHHAEGPVRMARVDGDRKWVLFDRESAVTPTTDRGRHFLQIDRERMDRLDLFDLGSDPEEQKPLGLGTVEASGSASAWSVLSGLDPYLEGLRLFVHPGTSDLSGELVSARPVKEVRSWFLGPEDEVSVEGTIIRFRFKSDGIPKGVVLKGSVGEIRSLRVSLEDGAPAPLFIGGREDVVMDEPLSLRALMTDDVPSGQGIHLWLRRPELAEGPAQRDEETRRRLKALGYAD